MEVPPEVYRPNSLWISRQAATTKTTAIATSTVIAMKKRYRASRVSSFARIRACRRAR